MASAATVLLILCLVSSSGAISKGISVVVIQYTLLADFSDVNVPGDKYSMFVSLGTPPSRYEVAVDTGSSFCWVRGAPATGYTGALYHPDSSSAHSTLPCWKCNYNSAVVEVDIGCNGGGDCGYNMTYVGQDHSRGVVSFDTLSVGSTQSPASASVNVSSFLFGYGLEVGGPTMGREAGIVGLNKHKSSLASQVASVIGSSVFAICLPSTNASNGYLAFGPTNYSSAPNVAYTALIPSPYSFYPQMYYIQLTSLSVDNKPLGKLPQWVPMMIDTGSLISRIPSDLYDDLSRTVVAALPGHLRRAPNNTFLETCFYGSYTDLPRVPSVSLQFAGNVDLPLVAPHSVFYDLDGKELGTVTCLFFSRAMDSAVLGSRQSGTFTVVFDRDAGRVGFAPGGCA